MEHLTFNLMAAKASSGAKRQVITGVVASGNLEVLVQRNQPPGTCRIDVSTAAHGFKPVWEAVLNDFAARRSAGGLAISINDGGARPDAVALRLAQAVRLIEEEDQ